MFSLFQWDLEVGKWKKRWKIPAQSNSSILGVAFPPADGEIALEKPQPQFEWKIGFIVLDLGGNGIPEAKSRIEFPEIQGIMTGSLISLDSGDAGPGGEKSPSQDQE